MILRIPIVLTRSQASPGQSSPIRLTDTCTPITFSLCFEQEWNSAVWVLPILQTQVDGGGYAFPWKKESFFPQPLAAVVTGEGDIPTCTHSSPWLTVNSTIFGTCCLFTVSSTDLPCQPGSAGFLSTPAPSLSPSTQLPEFRVACSPSSGVTAQHSASSSPHLPQAPPGHSVLHSVTASTYNLGPGI